MSEMNILTIISIYLSLTFPFFFTFKMVWAALDTDRTGYIKPNQYMTFWKVKEN